MRSLLYHGPKGEDLRQDPPVGLDRSILLELTRAQYRAVAWELPEDFLQFGHFRRVVCELDWNSSPGYPYLLMATTNRIFFEVDSEGVPSPLGLNRAWEMVQRRLCERDVDPIRLFIKPEPHKLKKIENKAYRLISSVSVVDQIIDAMLFEPMNKLLTENFMDVPAKVGWSPYTGGWKIIPPCGMMALDKSAWDWTVQGWLVQAELELREMLCKTRGELRSRWLELAKWRYKMLFAHPEFITSGGLVLRQCRTGIMKSGCVNTIASNSIMQSILHNRVCLELGIPVTPLMSMGDDTLQWQIAELQPYLDKLGEYCLVKQAENVSEFAGHRFKGWNVEPVYFGKHAFNILHMDPKNVEQFAASYALLYHRSHKREFMRGVFGRMNVEIPSMVFLDGIFDGES